MTTDRHREKPLSLRLGAERPRVEEYAHANGIPIRRVILNAVTAYLDQQETLAEGGK